MHKKKAGIAVVVVSLLVGSVALFLGLNAQPVPKIEKEIKTHQITQALHTQISPPSQPNLPPRAARRG